MFEKGNYEESMGPDDEQSQQAVYEKMITIYNEGNIQEMGKYVQGEGAFEDEDFENEILTKRNFKMTDTLEMLIQDQSVFCAVGVAHLPGKDGMIEILKSKGFQVRPVGATFTGLADAYEVKEVEIPWHLYRMKDFEASVLFPKAPFSFDVDLGDWYTKDEAVMTMDLSNITAFIAFSLNHQAFYYKPDNEAFYQSFIQNWTTDQGGKILNSKFLKVGGNNALQATVQDEENGFVIWQVVKVGTNIFMMAVSNEDGHFEKEVVDRFFNSLNIEESGVPEFYRLENEQGAFAFDMPQEPEQRRNAFKTSEYGIERELVSNGFITKDEMDETTYYVLYRTNPAGIVHQDLEASFTGFQETYEETFGPAVKADLFEFKGYPGIELIFDYNGKEVYLPIIARGNRYYFVMIEGENAPGGIFEERKKDFLDSFEFLPLKYLNLNKTTIDQQVELGFPNSFLKEVERGLNFPYSQSTTYYSLDTLSGLGYRYIHYPMNAFYSVKNYDSLMTADRNSFKKIEHLITFADTIFQGQPAMYMKEGYANSRTVLYRLAFYRGPNYYDLMVAGDAETPDSLVWNYYNSFHQKNPDYTYDYIKKDKSKALWQALESRDSATLASAKYAVNYIYFNKKDLPAIYHLIEKNMDYDTLTFPSVRSLMLRELKTLNDNTTLPFLIKLFEKSKEQPDLQKSILETCLEMKSKESLRTFFNYAPNFDKENNINFNSWKGFKSLKDTLSLTVPFVADLWKLVEHKSLRYYGLDMLNALYKDSLIAITELEKNIDIIVAQGNYILSKYDLLTNDSLIYEDEMHDLEKINDLLVFLGPSKKIDAFIKKEFQIKYPYLAVNGIRTGLKKNIPVAREHFESIFKSKYNWYYLLRETSKENTFDKVPKELYNQDIVVEGLIVFELEYEYGVVRNFTTLRKDEVSKDKKRYLLHVFQFNVEGYENPLIGICTQPANSDEVNLLPYYYDYYSWDADEKTQAEVIEEAIKAFKDWEEGE